MRTTIALVLTATLASPLHAQRDSSARQRFDSVALDTLFNGPPYVFTGAEDSLLLARMFQETFKLGLGDAGAGNGPAVLCLGVGRDHPSDAPASVLRLLANHRPPVRPASACRHVSRGDRPVGVRESATGAPAWTMTIQSLSRGSGDTLIVYSYHYVAPLWAAGWVCRALPSGHDWRLVGCSMTWIS